MKTPRIRPEGTHGLWVAGCLAITTCVGCSESPTPPTAAEAPSVVPGPSAPAPAVVDADPLTEIERANIAKLPESDRAAALAQKVCPVGEGHLGDEGMGVPVKATVEGVSVFLCCEACRPELEKNPGKYLARLRVSDAAGR
ncbi:MAG: hypothetical protein SFX72_06440 [Isosphaeraceae bacterium]|nr:hypothetical protein [Isosphaeraceae bacterium]